MTEIEPNLLAHSSPDSALTLRRFSWLSFLLVAILVVCGLVRFTLNSREAAALESQTRDSLQRSVNFIYAKPGNLVNNISLPATLRGYSEAVLFARSNGYLAAWYKTLGDKVQKGELLAQIETPEQTQELLQAQALLEQMQARQALAKLTQERWEVLRQRESVTQQDLEEKRSLLAQANAELEIAKASVKRLQQLEDFRRITAPFSGTIVSRNVDVGALVSAGTNPLFTLAQTEKLRISLWVPQVYANGIKQGQEVKIRLNEIQDKTFSGKIAHVAGAIDPVTRSRQVEIQLPNPDGKLIPGAFADVELELASDIKALIVPAGVLILGKEQPRIAVLNTENKVEFHTVKLGRDLGKTVEILSGITKEDKLVLNPADSLEENEIVIAKELAVQEDKKPGPADNKEKNPKQPLLSGPEGKAST
ncbi:efflux RND transporter periplasmic adaptor subunit [Methylobacillus arboreus]|uniref:efflux RND transporter periplasmic adaptor subunit n=1 Tax=Methylobacillus arboreus TaxID=755170 RepID=UPI001E5F9FBC|nr:efflux RND transporter periplasmic adaptor subunit [Methylobacillus arboreus]MCB5189131.1 efflux RND transporter periplasmic adaptor subunit [Methylobacillus arboreus]